MAILWYVVGMLIAFLPIYLLWFWWRNRGSLLINWPVVGMTPSIFSNLNRVHDYLTFLLQQSGGTYLFKGPWFTDIGGIVTSDPRIVHYTMTKNFANYIKGSDSKEIFEALGDGIFNVDSDSWRFQRRAIHSLLKHKGFEMAVKRTMEQKILKGLFLVFENDELDIQDVFQRFTFDCICILVLSFDPKCLSIEFPLVPFEKAFSHIEEGIFYRHIVPRNIWKLQRWLQIGEEKKMTKALEAFDNFVEQCISRKREQLAQRKNSEEKENFDLLTYFLMEDDYKVAEDGNFSTTSDKFLRDMAFNLLLAGRDTVGAGLCWLFWLVATHPLVEKKILEEMEEQLGENSRGEKWRVFSLQEVNKLVYLHAVICETLRLYPPIPFEFKVAVESDVLPGGHEVAKNTRILYSLYSMGRMKEIWGEDCLEFKPERWISEGGGIIHAPSYKFIAFNAGPRSCLGKDLGILEMKLVASAIMWNYSIKVVENQHITPSKSLVLYMENGLKVRVSKRRAS